MSAPVPSAIVAASIATLTQHGRTFRLAAYFLPPETRDDAAVLYAFCREVDDLADLSSDEAAAGRRLEAVEAELLGRTPARPGIAALLDVATRRAMDLSPALDLVAAVRADMGAVRIADDAALVDYCYGVAGTVGLLMTAVLGARDHRAAPHAVDLGIAMQLTNLCRDVLEDAKRGRVYLPATRLRSAGIDAETLVEGGADPARVAQVVSGLLELADGYYASAREGMVHIPGRSRYAIHVAAAVYRAIGVRLLRRHGGNPLLGRTVVPPLHRIGWALVGLVQGARATLHARKPRTR